MADRFNRTARTARETSGLGIDLISVPDIQSDINKKLSFLDSIQKMQQRAAAAQAASAAAAQGTFIGIDPATGEPVYMKGLPKSITKDERAAAMKVWSQRKAQSVIGQDAELNRIKSELYSGKPLSTKRQSDLLTQARARTSALAKTYGINDTDAFQETFGTASKKAAEETATLDEASGGPFDLASTFLAGARQGFNSLVSGAMQLVSPADTRAKLAKENTARNQEIAMANPVLRERTLREQEAAAEGKELGYFDATEGSTFANMVGTLGNIAGSFGPAIVATPLLAAAGAPAGVAAIAPSVAASVAVGQGAYNERVAGTEGLTPEQQEAAISYDNPGALINLGVNAAAGALFPGRVISGAKQMAGNAVARRLTAREIEQRAAMPGGPNFVGPIHPSESLTGAIAGPPNPYAAEVVNGLNGLERYTLQAGQKAGIRAAAPRSAGTLVRDVAGNSLENAGIMGLATVGSNAAYNVGTGQDTPLTQGLSEGMVTGGLMGLPFGYMQYRGRPKKSSSSIPPASSSSSSSSPTPPSPNVGKGATPSSSVVDMFGAPKKNGKEPKAVIRANDDNWVGAINDYLYPTDEAAVVERARNLRTRLNIDQVDAFNNDADFKDKWYNPIIKAARKGDDAAVDQLMGEYIASGGTIDDLEYMLFSHAKGKVLKRVRNDAADNGKFPPINTERTDGWGSDKRDKGLRTFAGALANLRNIEREGGLNGYLANFNANDGLSSIMGKLGRSRPESPAGKGSGTGGPLDPHSTGSPTGDTSGFDAQNRLGGDTAKGRRAGRASQQGVGQDETPESNIKKDGDATPEDPNAGRDLNGAGKGDKQPRVGAGGDDDKAGRSDGSELNATPDSEQSKPASSITPDEAQPQVTRTTRAEQYEASKLRFAEAVANNKDLKSEGFRAAFIPSRDGDVKSRSLRVEIRDASTGRAIIYKDIPKGTQISAEGIAKRKIRWRVPDEDETSRNNGSEVPAKFSKELDDSVSPLISEALMEGKDLQLLSDSNKAKSNKLGGEEAKALGLEDIYRRLSNYLLIRDYAKNPPKDNKALKKANKIIREAVQKISDAFRQNFPFLKNYIKTVVLKNNPNTSIAGSFTHGANELGINYGHWNFSAGGILGTIQHEATHGIYESLSPSLRNALFDLYDRQGVAQKAIDIDSENALRRQYINTAKNSNRASTSVTMGDEIGANIMENTDWVWVYTANNIGDAIADGARMLITENPDSIAAIRAMTVALATNRTPENLRDALIQSIIDTPEIREMYLNTSLSDLQNGMSPFKDASAMAIKTAEDYVRLTEMGGIQRNEGSLREYLTEVFDPRTTVDVYSKASQIC